MSVKSEAMNQLNRFLKQIPELMELGTATSQFVRWKRSAQIAIENTFGENSRHIREFTEVRFHTSTVIELIVAKQIYQEGLVKARIHLESMLKEIENDWSEDGPPRPLFEAQEIPVQQMSNQVFVVHGRDDGAKNTVARFLESLDLEAVILHEQPNEGRTIVEKFEDFSDVGFAVILCTPDDVGGLATDRENLRPRPRQNVVLELGSFLGRLGRNRVCAVLEGDMEMPSDYSGVLYISLDDSESWKVILARELRAAGMTIDINLVI